MNKIISIAIIITLLLCFYTYSSIYENKKAKQEKSESSVELKNIKSKVFQTENGWGYDIRINNKIFIKQNYIPSINGDKAFKNALDAQKTANYVIKKLIAGQKLPSLSYHELDSLNVL